METAKSQKFQQFLKTLGPGIMFAGTCIGGSHLVQSTKAGAYYGFGLIGIVLIANLLKYPFFEFASRYTNATGDSILEGYKRQGKWVLMVYGIVTVISMFIITSAIGAFTGGLLNNLTLSFIDINLPGHYWTLILFVIVLLLLMKGQFSILDTSLKVIGIILVVTTTIAFFAVLFSDKTVDTSQGMVEIMTESQVNPETGDLFFPGLMFAIALMGWMPIAVDMSSWASLWTQERIKQTGYHPTLKETLLDFNIGYIITVVLGIFFLSIGAYSLYNHPEITSEKIAEMSGLEYSKTLVDIFKTTIGTWGYYVMLIAAFATMFGTTVTLIDGYCRSIERTGSLLFSDRTHEEFHKKKYIGWVITLMIGSYLIILFYVSSLGQIMNLATTLSFIIAPFAAILNFKLMFSKELPNSHKPSNWLKILALAGIIFLTVFTIIYLYQKA